MTARLIPLLHQAIAAEESQCRRLAAIPGWRPYIEDKAKRLAREDAAMYGHLPKLVADAIAETTKPNPQEKPTHVRH